MALEERATVLIVEDDLGVAHLVRARLERAGYSVETAGSAEEGMERVRCGGIDLLILDQRLPSGISGLQLYERIKAAGFEAPAILATGFSDEATLLQALRVGVRDFVPKTADYLNYLVPAVARVLKEVRTERELAESRASAREALSRQRELEAEIAERKIAEKEREKAQQALREADRRKDEFLAMLAHELRNPLAPIRNALEMLKLVEASPELQRQTREMMERQVQLMVRLVDDLLDVSRITRGKIELRKEPIELAAIVTRAVETAQPLIDAQKHQSQIDIAPGPLLVQGDLVRLGQVVANLLNNAAKYMAPGGRIRLKAGREADKIVLRLRDEGIGIAPEMLPQVFDLFTQADHAPALSQGGLGIGLTLVRRLVEMHGGTVEAHSEGIGRGSEFVVSLPALLEAPPAPHSAGDAAGDSAPMRRILVVDDNIDSAESLAMLLRVWGHEVETAHNGSEALAAAPACQPEVALLDIDLPDMTGYELASKLRGRAGKDATAFVALTGYGQDGDHRRSAEAGFRAHLVKPVDPEALRKLLATLAL
jgi:signal transduction histidine kinase